jgi:hypothetical protein
MTIAAAQTIRLAGPDGVQEEFLVASGATLKPGMLVRRTSATECNVHNVSGGDGATLILHEDALQGLGVDDSAAAATRVYAEYVIPGAKRYARLKANENVSVGDHLISGGDGTLIKTTGSPVKVFAICEEASNVASQQLIQVRFI